MYIVIPSIYKYTLILYIHVSEALVRAYPPPPQNKKKQTNKQTKQKSYCLLKVNDSYYFS